MDVQKTKQVITHIANMMDEKKTLSEDITEAIKVQSEELNIDKKQLRKLATIHHKQNFIEYKTENEEVMDSYKAIMG